MFEDDAVYFRRRAAVELEQARHSSDRSVAVAHRQLAKAYLARVTSRGQAGDRTAVAFATEAMVLHVGA